MVRMTTPVASVWASVEICIFETFLLTIGHVFVMIGKFSQMVLQ